MLYYLIPRVCFNGCLQSSTAWSHPPTWQRSPPSSPLSSVCPHLLVWSGSARPFFTGPSCKMRSWRPSWMPVLTTLPPPHKWNQGCWPSIQLTRTYRHVPTHASLFPSRTGSELLIMSARWAVHQRADATTVQPGVPTAGLRGEAMSKKRFLNRPV